jgi:mannose/fructose-specific phosphotransferase system component IIA
MSEAGALIVAHGSLAQALVEAAERIAGVSGALVAISNLECSPETLRTRILESRPPGPTIVFVDMRSGSCGLASLGVARDVENIAVVSGVNLPMVLDFLFHRDMELAELARRLVRKGRAATTAYTSPGVSDADHAVPD